jgi:hypothetical protein
MQTDNELPMTQELGKFSGRPLIDLQHVEKAYPTGDLLGEEMRAEIRRRQTGISDRRARFHLIYLRLSIVLAIMAVAVAVYAVVRHHQ